MNYNNKTLFRSCVCVESLPNINLDGAIFTLQKSPSSSGSRFRVRWIILEMAKLGFIIIGERLKDWEGKKGNLCVGDEVKCKSENIKNKIWVEDVMGF